MTYRNPTWARIDSITDPVMGNHEYKTGPDAFRASCPATMSTAQSFFSHFGPDSNPMPPDQIPTRCRRPLLVRCLQLALGGLRSNCPKSGVGGCAATSAQTTWLKADLSSTSQLCIAAFCHKPLFTGVGTGKPGLPAMAKRVVCRSPGRGAERAPAQLPAVRPDESKRRKRSQSG